MQAFKDEKILMENVPNHILDDLRVALNPRKMIVKASFMKEKKAGFKTTVSAEHPYGNE